MLNRRQFLQSSSGSLLLGLLEGCSLANIKPPDCPHFSAPNALNVIDVHCHIFNATDLQVGDFLRRVVVNDDANSPIAIIAPAIQELGWNFAPGAKEELQWLTSRRSDRELVLKPAKTQFGLPATTAILPAISTDSQARFESFYGEFKQRRPQDFESFTRSYRERTSSFQMQRAARGLMPPRFGALARPDDLSAALASPAGLSAALANESVGGAPPLLSFVKSFFRYRTENVAGITNVWL